MNSYLTLPKILLRRTAVSFNIRKDFDHLPLPSFFQSSLFWGHCLPYLLDFLLSEGLCEVVGVGDLPSAR